MVALFHVSVTHVNIETLKVATTNTSVESQKEKSAATLRQYQSVVLIGDGIPHEQHDRPQLQRSKHRPRQLRVRLAVAVMGVQAGGLILTI